MRGKLVLKAVGFISLTMFFLFLWQTSVFRITKNFYEVDPGKLYRSAQLTPQELESAIKEYGLKTVISLRGAPENSFWMPGQKKVLENHRVVFYHFQWPLDYFPRKEDLLRFNKVLKEAQRPILIHGRSGADRVGEAVVIYALDYMTKPRAQLIREQLNFRFWHIPWVHPAKLEFLMRYQGWSWALQQYSHCSDLFRAWAPPGSCSSRF